MKKDFLRCNALRHSKYNQTIDCAFTRFDQLLATQAACSDFVNSSEIQKLFQGPVYAEQITVAQLVIIAQLYDLFLTYVIAQTHAQMQHISDAKQYWARVLLQKSLSLHFKHPGFLMHQKSPKETIEKRILLFESMQAEKANLLGICLHGKHQLQKIHEIDDIELRLKEVVASLCSFACGEEPSSVLDFFQKIGPLFLSVQERIEMTNTALKTHGIPQHVNRYWYAYSALTVVAIAGLIVWYENKEHVAEHQEKVLRATHGFLQDVLFTPARGLKRALWDRPELGLEKFDLQNVPNTIWSCYTPERATKYILQTILFNMNKGVELLEEIIKGQRINYYLSAIIPVVAGTYAIYRNGRYYYNHESYFKPMRMVLREVDIVCNKLSGKTDGISFADSGSLYFLVSQLNLYMSCLYDYEQTMMKYDMEELVSFDFTIAQKQKVIERMYHSYAFLRVK